MKPLLRVLSLALFAAVLHFIIIGVFIFAKVGAFGRAIPLLIAAMPTRDDAAAERVFQAAEQFVILDRLLLWPAVFLFTSLLYVRYVPTPRWWHSLVIASAVLLASSFPGPPPLSGMSTLTPWLHLSSEVLASALLIAGLSYVLRKLRSLSSGKPAAA